MNKYIIDTLHDDIINELTTSSIIKKSSYILKELLENSCDANSKNIYVYIENNGLDLIRVIDDGDGINKYDLHKCGLKYTTSKIKYAEDLKTISSYGFKGESLNLIKDISQLVIISKTKNQKCAYKIIHLADNKYIIEECAGVNGTDVIIKHIKTNNLIKVNDNIFLPQKLIALANFNIHFRFYKDLKEIKNLPPCYDSHSIAKRIENLIDKNYLENSMSVNYENKGINLQGFISENNNKYINNENNNFLFLNKRYIEDTYLNNFIKNSLKEKTNKKLNYILYLTINPENLHITKTNEDTKVYFHNIKNLLDIITDSLKKYSKNKFFYNLFKKKVKVLNIKDSNEFQAMNKNISSDMIYKSDDKILTVLDNKTIFFELNKKVYITNLINIRSKIIIEEAIKQIIKYEKLNSRKLQETIFINFENKEKIKIYKNILIKYGFNLENFFDEKIIIQSIPEIIFNLPINLDNLILDTINFLDKNISTFFSINRFDINIIKLFIKNLDINYCCLDFEIKKIYEEIKNCYNSNDTWFKKYCFEVSCNKALNSFKI
ncbi:MAG TPA: DNA mismatch repair endonuclease MutL [Candidatus Azoamicus sp.]